jgi:D-methionine transport system permease protein
MSILDIEFLGELLKALGETGIMLSIGLLAALVFGGTLGIFLFLWRPDGLRANKVLSLTIGTLVNIVRSFPFVILLISVGPLTRFLTGTTIGPVAAAVPLSIAAIAYFARIVELSLNDVPKGIIEAALSMGASLREIVFKFLLVEARSSLILGYTTLIVSFISYSAAAGIVGGGGIGDLAIRYGYYRFQTDVMVITIVILIVIVQLVQVFGGYLASKYNRR